MKITVIAAAAALAALSLGSSAGAAITSTVVSATPVGDRIVETFDAPAATGFSFSPLQSGSTAHGYQSGLYTSSITNIALEPTGDTSTYYSVLGHGDVGTLTSTTALKSLSVEIGSVDAYNTVSFYDGATLVGSVGGDQMLPGADNGRTSNYYDFNDTTGTFDKVTFASSVNSLELDNIGVAAVSSAPEPSTWMLMIAGVGLMGVALRRKLSTAAMRLA